MKTARKIRSLRSKILDSFHLYTLEVSGRLVLYKRIHREEKEINTTKEGMSCTKKTDPMTFFSSINSLETKVCKEEAMVFETTMVFKGVRNPNPNPNCPRRMMVQNILVSRFSEEWIIGNQSTIRFNFPNKRCRDQRFNASE